MDSDERQLWTAAIDRLERIARAVERHTYLLDVILRQGAEKRRSPVLESDGAAKKVGRQR